MLKGNKRSLSRNRKMYRHGGGDRIPIDIENDSFTEINEKIKTYKKKHKKLNKTDYVCTTCDKPDLPLTYISKGRDGIVFSRPDGKVIKFMDDTSHVENEGKCLRKMRKYRNLTPELKSSHKYSVTQSFMHGIPLGEYLDKKETENDPPSPAESSMENEFIRFIDMMIEIGVHNGDSNTYNIMIAPDGHFQILDFSDCFIDRSRLEMIAYFSKMFFYDKLSKSLRHVFPKTKKHVQSLICTLNKEERIFINKYTKVKVSSLCQYNNINEDTTTTDDDDSDSSNELAGLDLEDEDELTL